MKATKILLTAMLAFMSGLTANAAVENPSAGTRVDYINAKGERFSSSMINRGLQLFQVSPLGVIASTTMDENTVPNTIRFVPWGTESYDVNLDTEVPVQYYVKSSKKQKTGRLRANNQGDLNVLCGDTVVLIMELPDNAFPEFELQGEYTGNLPGGGTSVTSISKVPFSSLPFIFHDPKLLTDPDYMNMNVPYWIEGTPYISRLPANDKCNNRWSWEFVMPNEPYMIKIGYGYADSKQLATAVQKILYETLYTQHGDLNWNGNSGENWIMRYIGEGMSTNQINGIALYNPKGLYGMTALSASDTYFCAIPWANYYCGIVFSNLLLDNLGLFTNATETERNIAKAQLLSLRAHCYTRVLQIFGKRWSESDGGKAFCAPLILDIEDFQKPLATMAEIKEQCENDLNEAIRIFGNANYKHSTLIEPDLNVARGLLMRLALWTNDWQTARDMARQLLADVPLSTNQDMLAGFYTRTNSWIWGVSTYVDESDPFNKQIYAWAPQNYDACNGVYGHLWTIGPHAIDRDLWLKIPENDMRRQLFVMPEIPPCVSLRKIENWYSSGSYSDMNMMFLKDNTAIINTYKKKRPEANAFYYNDPYERSYNVPYGAQLKFWGTGIYYGYDESNKDGGTLFMRSDEALLAQAEACWHLGDEATARTLLTQLNSMRNEGYSCTATGQNLLDEIRLYRRIELWGEGFSWFDQKRWNLPISRNLWKEGDITSGNWPATVPATVETSAANGWRAVIPAYYTKQNPNIDISKMEYVNATGYDAQQPTADATPAKVSDKDFSKAMMPSKEMQPAMSK